VEVDGAALREMFPGGGWGGPFSKSLRYGATLELIKVGQGKRRRRGNRGHSLCPCRCS
jgi:hypothetical protein